jgi:hypothetical protein
MVRVEIILQYKIYKNLVIMSPLKQINDYIYIYIGPYPETFFLNEKHRANEISSFISLANKPYFSKIK